MIRVSSDAIFNTDEDCHWQTGNAKHETVDIIIT